MAFNCFSGELTVFVAPSINYINWKSPKTLSRTFFKGLKNRKLKAAKGFYATNLGHGAVYFNCTDSNGINHHQWTGMAGNEDLRLYKAPVFKDRDGVNVLFENFEDGYVQSTTQVIKAFASYYGRKIKDDSGSVKKMDIRYLKYEINHQQCDEVVKFYEAFREVSYVKPQRRKVRKQLRDDEKLFYGLTAKPYELYLKKTENPESKTPLGGGCTSFMAAFLKAAGLYQDLFDAHFIRTIPVSYQENKEEDVTLSQLIFTRKGNSWTSPGTPTKNLSFYDPELIWKFMDGLYTCQESLVNEGKIMKNDTCTKEMAELLQSDQISVEELDSKTIFYGKKIKTLKGIVIH